MAGKSSGDGQKPNMYLKLYQGWVWWHMPAIPATWEDQARGLQVQGDSASKSKGQGCGSVVYYSLLQSWYPKPPNFTRDLCPRWRISGQCVPSFVGTLQGAKSACDPHSCHPPSSGTQELERRATVVIGNRKVFSSAPDSNSKSQRAKKCELWCQGRQSAAK